MMTVRDSHSLKIAKKTNYELIEILNNKEKFKDEILLLTIKEMDNRGLTHPSLDELKQQLISEDENSDFRERKEDQEKKGLKDLDSLPKLYSNVTIYLFSVFFGVYFGGILFILNLKAAKAKGIWEVIAFVILYMMVMITFLQTQGSYDVLLVFFMNAIGGVILNTLFKQRFLSHVKIFEKRNGFYPLLVGMLVMSVIMFLLGGAAAA